MIRQGSAGRLRHRDSIRLLGAAFCVILQGCHKPVAADAGDPHVDAQNAPVLRDTRAGIAYLMPQYSWEPPPTGVAAAEGFLDVGGAKLWYRDTGGVGEAVVFSHPGSGSAMTWAYQIPFLKDAGYRVIAYSRRGHYQSEITDAADAGSAADDLLRLVDRLGIDRFHLVAVAAGTQVAVDFAMSHPDRLLSLVAGCTASPTGDPAYTATNELLMPPEFTRLPTWVKELSPFYRGANPEGTELWKETSALTNSGQRAGIVLDNEVTPERLASIRLPTLLFTGDADFYMPPSRLRDYAKYWTHPKLAIIRGAGHAPYWEQPGAFNGMVLEFIRRNGTGRSSMRP